MKGTRPPSLPSTASTLAGALGRETGDKPLGSARWPYGATRAPRRRLAFLGDRRERGPVARGSRQWEPSLRGRRSGTVACTRRMTQPSRQSSRRADGALERGRAAFQPVNATLTVRFFKKLNCATKTVDTKVVDETSLYNICKGRPMFFSTV
jgi:hypothetical protein